MIEIKRKGQAAAEMPAERAQMPAEGLDAQARGIHALSAEPALKREIRPFTGIDEKREELFQEFLDAKYSDFHFRTMEDFEELQKVNLARRKTQSKYVRSRLMDNVREQSNGESAFRYFVEKIGEDGLYLLDEPENSLSPARQQELVEFLESSARFFGCQFIIATHSPFLLAMRGAKIYDLDEDPAAVRKWTQLENVRAYDDFFKRHAEEF